MAAALFHALVPQEHPRPARCPVLALSPVQQERGPAVLAGLPHQNPGTAEICLRRLPYLRLERSGQIRYRRNSDGLAQREGRR